MVAARCVVDNLVERGFKEGHVAYGINTGFGLFSDVIIGHDKLKKLQVMHCSFSKNDEGYVFSNSKRVLFGPARAYSHAPRVA